MSPLVRLMLLLVTLPIGSSLGSEWNKHEVALGKLDVRLQQLADRIQAVQGKGICEKNEQCKVIGLGGLVCNLHKDFLIYSTKDALEALLLARVAEFNRSHQKILDKILAPSSCGTVPAAIHCVSGFCTPDLLK